MILLFLSIAISLGAQDHDPFFKDFVLGQSLEEVRRTLRSYQAFLQKRQKKPFRMELPLFFYLSFLAKSENLSVDLEKQRIYLDESYFFDFQETIFRGKDFDFYYENEYYYLVFHRLQSFPVEYPSRVNPHLFSLKFKFFDNILYSIEYRARLKPYQIHRFQEKYLQTFGVSVNRKENSFEAGKGRYYIEISPEKEEVRVLITSLEIYKKIEVYVQESIHLLLQKIVAEIEKKLNKSFGLTKLLFQERKNILKKKIREIYKSIDEL